MDLLKFRWLTLQKIPKCPFNQLCLKHPFDPSCWAQPDVKEMLSCAIWEELDVCHCTPSRDTLLLECVRGHNWKDIVKGYIITSYCNMSLETRYPVASQAIEKNAMFIVPKENFKKRISAQKNPEVVVKEFKKLLDTSYGFFMNLRDLPINGKYWKYYFCKTFEIYTKLWKFQKENRSILEDKKVYGLGRWEIGDIASKIGQLYYHYYLKTSNTKYLNESMVFYDAIRSRNYMKTGKNAISQSLMHKKLRCYARFIITCILLAKFQLAKTLIKETTELMDDPNIMYNENEKDEWSIVLRETNEFIEALNAICVTINDKIEYINLDLPCRLEMGEIFEHNEKDTILSEAVLICCHKNQVKFSELTMDLYRLTLCLELDQKCIDSPGMVKNIAVPHKHVLFCPSIYRLIATISSVVKGLSSDSIALIYLSARGENGTCEDGSSSYTDDRSVMVSRSPFYNSLVPICTSASPNANLHPPSELISSPRTFPTQKRSSFLNDALLYPFDFAPFMRKSLFMIIDSACSFSFMSFENIFANNCVIFLSPEKSPYIDDPKTVGSPISLFLYSPARAFCMCSQIKNTTFEIWSNVLNSVFMLEKHIGKSFIDLANRYSVIKKDEFSPYTKLIGSPILFRLLIRFVFMTLVLSKNKNTVSPECIPRSIPPIPPEILNNSDVRRGFEELITITDVNNIYNDI